MTFDQILTDIHNKVFYPIYFLMGEEPYFIDTISDTLENEILDEADKAFNQIVLYGRDVDKVENIVSHAKNYPMMGNYLVVIVKEAQDVSNIEDLEKYLNVIPPTTILVIDYKYKKLDKRRALSKSIEKKGVLFESKKLYDDKIAPWIAKTLEARKYQISEKAAQMLADYLGSDLHKIRNELEKLFIALPKPQKITDADIERNIGISKDFNVFELQSAIGKRDVLKANRIMDYFGDNPKSNPLVVTNVILFGYFCKILKVHYTQNKTQNNLASVLMVSPFFVKDYLDAARNYSIADCVRCIAVLREFDMKCKGYEIGDVSEAELDRELIFKLMHAC